MRFRFLNKSIENRQFDYTPMYYDERKEVLKQKKEFYQKVENGELSADERRAVLRENLRSEYRRSDYRKSANRTSNYRILLLIAVLVALGYFIFNGVDQVDTVVKKLW